MPQVPDDAKPALDLLRSVGGDELLTAISRTFLDFALEEMAKLVEAEKLRDIATIANIAHALKSSSRQLGAFALGEACADAETAGKEGNAELALDGIKAIQREFAAATPWLESLAGDN
jgi:HPt (histidine-containing phosphotransfer) domain-containing protein